MASDNYVVFTILVSFFYVVSACYDNDLYVIKSAAFQGLVVDGSDPLVTTLQYFTNSSAQLWKFEPSKKVGFFYIINSLSGKALDFHPGPPKDMYVIQKKKRNTKRQQWNLRMDGKIINRECRRFLDINAALFIPGIRIFLWKDSGNQAQEFVVDNLEELDFEELKNRIN